MKFIYIDESGGQDQGDVFTMFGLMVDAYKLRKKTEEFDCMLGELFAEHRGSVMAEPSAGVFLTLSGERMNRSRGGTIGCVRYRS